MQRPTFTPSSFPLYYPSNPLVINLARGFAYVNTFVYICQ